MLVLLLVVCVCARNIITSTSSPFNHSQGRALWVARLGGIRVSSEAPWVQERLIVGMVKSPVEGSKIVLIKVSRVKIVLFSFK